MPKSPWGDFDGIQFSQIAMKTTIYIQKIRTDWTKASRGAPKAALRNRVPELLPFDLSIMDGPDFLFQEIRFSEYDFARPEVKPVKAINHNQVRQYGLAFEEADGDNRNVFFWSEVAVGKCIGMLQPNTWCQIKANRRVIMDYTWGYYKEVFTIFFGEVRKAPSILQSKPAAFRQDYQTLLI